MREPPSIEAYGGGGFRIGGERLDGSVLILEDVASTWSPRSLAELSPEHFAAVIAAGREAVEFVLLGLGPAMAPPPRAVREALKESGLGLEVMDTPAACRLYNVLAADGRRLACGLIAV